jgi:hypothetical protein
MFKIADERLIKSLSSHSERDRSGVAVIANRLRIFWKQSLAAFPARIE